MIYLGEKARVFLALGATDMRKAINGLSLLVADELEGELFNGDYFAFCNRARTIVKILYWDRNGFCLWQKRLEKDHFKWPKEQLETREIGKKELTWLLDGLDIRQAHEKLSYTTID